MSDIEDISPSMSIPTAEDEVYLPDNFQEVPLQNVGGMRAGSDSLTHGKVRIAGTEERIYMGDADDVMSGVGIFMGQRTDSDDNKYYDFRFGDPSGNYIRWNEETGDLNIKGSITLDSDVDGTNMSDIKDGADRGLNGLNASYQIVKGFVDGDFESASDPDPPTEGIKIDSTGIKGYQSGESSPTFYIKNDGNAYFQGKLGATELETDNLITDSSGHRIELRGGDNDIDFYNVNDDLTLRIHGAATNRDSSQIDVGGGIALKGGVDATLNSETLVWTGGFGTNGVSSFIEADNGSTTASFSVRTPTGEGWFYGTNSGPVLVLTDDGGLHPDLSYASSPDLGADGDEFYNIYAENRLYSPSDSALIDDIIDVAQSGGGDDLGDHTADQDLDMSGYVVTDADKIEGGPYSADANVIDLSLDAHIATNQPWNINGYGTPGSSVGLGVGGDIEATGAKNFDIPHPLKDDEDERLKYTSMEGPETALFYRGTAETKNGELMIEFPDHYAYMITQDRSVNLTPHSNTNIWVDEITEKGVKVKSEDDTEFSYMVMGKRRDYEDKPVEYNRNNI